MTPATLSPTLYGEMEKYVFYIKGFRQNTFNPLNFESIFQVVDLDNCADAHVLSGEGEYQELSSLGPNAP